MKRREFVACAGAGAVMAGVGSVALAQAPAAAGFVEGQHYVRLQQPLNVSVPAGKIEVVEFFWYGCPHCNVFEPTLEAWIKTLPADVVFRRAHVGFRPTFKPLQQLYCTLEVMGLVESMQRKVFSAIHERGERLDSPQAVIDFAVRSGIDRAKFTEVYNSFGVQTKVQQGARLAEAYKIDGVPALGIQGRFYTSPALAGGEHAPEVEGARKALALADQLIARVRKGG